MDIRAIIKPVHKEAPSIYAKIRWSFTRMAFIIALFFWTIIYIAESRFESLSLNHWLEKEAELYVHNYQQFQHLAPPPNSLVFDFYWSLTHVPEWLEIHTQLGFYGQEVRSDEKSFGVFRHPSGKGLMYIVFKGDSDEFRDEYESALHHFTLYSVAILCLVMFLYGIHIVRILSRPLNVIVNKIDRMPPQYEGFEVETRFSETRYIEQALVDGKKHIAHNFQREQEFNRFASHELRTPIMVIKGSADILNRVSDLPRVALKSIQRTQRACEDMRVLTEVFLLLGKEEINSRHFEQVDLAKCIEKQLEEVGTLFIKEGAQHRFEQQGNIHLLVPKSFISIVINNLVKNAFCYSSGDVFIDLNNHRLQVRNQFEADNENSSGYGYGLIIIERICERMNWQFTHRTEAKQFIAQVIFN